MSLSAQVLNATLQRSYRFCLKASPATKLSLLPIGQQGCKVERKYLERKETLHDYRSLLSIPAGTQANSGCAPHPGCCFVGSAHLAISRHEQSSHGNGPDDGNEHRTFHCDLGGNDDRDDVPHGSPDDPHVYNGVRWQEAKLSGLCPDLGLRQCVCPHLDAVRPRGLSSH